MPPLTTRPAASLSTRPLTEAQRRWAEHHLAIAAGIAAVQRREHPDIDADELESACLLGLCVAARSYDAAQDRDGRLAEKWVAWKVKSTLLDVVYRRHDYLGDKRKLNRTGVAVPEFGPLPGAKRAHGQQDTIVSECTLPAPPTTTEAAAMPSVRTICYTAEDLAAEFDLPPDAVERMLAEHGDRCGVWTVVRPSGSAVRYVTEAGVEAFARLVDDGLDIAARNPPRCPRCLSRIVKAEGTVCGWCVAKAKRAERREALAAGQRDGFGGG